MGFQASIATGYYRVGSDLTRFLYAEPDWTVNRSTIFVLFFLCCLSGLNAKEVQPDTRTNNTRKIRDSVLLGSWLYIVFEPKYTKYSLLHEPSSHCGLRLPIYVRNGGNGTLRVPRIFLIGHNDGKVYDIWTGESSRNRNTLKPKQNLPPGDVWSAVVFSVPKDQEYTVYLGSDLVHTASVKVHIGGPYRPVGASKPKKKSPVRQNMFFSD